MNITDEIKEQILINDDDKKPDKRALQVSGRVDEHKYYHKSRPAGYDGSLGRAQARKGAFYFIHIIRICGNICAYAVQKKRREIPRSSKAFRGQKIF